MHTLQIILSATPEEIIELRNGLVRLENQASSEIDEAGRKGKDVDEHSLFRFHTYSKLRNQMEHGKV